MKDKEMIEEMARDYYGYSIDLQEDCKFVAEEMYDRGHRKIDKDSVVLSRKEYERLKNQAKIKCDVENIREAVFDVTSCVIGYETAEKIYQHCFPDKPEQFVKERKPSYNDGYFDGSKETAEKFVNEAIKRKQTLINPYTDDESECVSIYWIYELAKQFGVEIKE